jgi:hypothetical protein
VEERAEEAPPVKKGGQARADVLLFPYLWLRKRRTVGPYELIPKATVTEDDFSAPWVKKGSEGLLKLYELDGSMGNRFGTIVRRSDGKIGDDFERSEMRPLRRALVAALLDGNPSHIGLGDDHEGWSVSTSDHAVLYGHSLDPAGGITVDYGRMVQVLVGGLKIGDDHSTIHAPNELHVAFLASDPDEVYADALYTELKKETPEARRLGRAIDWLNLAWRNTPSIDDDTRIAAIFFGFEVLLGREGLGDLRTALGMLIASEQERVQRPVPRRPRQGQPAEIASRELNETEWWFAFFGLLRNDIAHGNRIEPKQYFWDDQSHLFLGEAHLRRAIKQTVANAGHEIVMLDPFERIEAQFLGKLGGHA